MNGDFRQHLERVRGEYVEMPCLRLTAAQAARFWALDHSHCEAMLARLAAEGFLRRTDDGAYVRNGSAPRARRRRSDTHRKPRWAPLNRRPPGCADTGSGTLADFGPNVSQA